MEIDFKDDFNTRILSRGYEYYEDGLVEDVLLKGNIVMQGRLYVKKQMQIYLLGSIKKDLLLFYLKEIFFK